MAVSPHDGQLRGIGVSGVWRDGRRVLARSVLLVAGAEPEPLSGQVVGSGTARFLAMRRLAVEPSPDPAVVVERVRGADGRERVVIRNTARRSLRVPVELLLGTDLVPLGELRSGRCGVPLQARVERAGLGWSAPDGVSARVHTDPPPDTALAAAGSLRWELTLAPGASWAMEMTLSPPRPAAGLRAVAAGAAPWAEARVRCDDTRLAAWVAQSLRDLRSLLVADAGAEPGPLLVAGAPWQLMPTGRDSLWVARMLLPLGTRLAHGTLRYLAARQGARPDPRTGEEPGRVPHTLGGPGGWARYDCAGSTALFVTLLADAWRWGMPETEVLALLPHARRALGHLAATLDAAPDGLVRLGARGPAPCELQAQYYDALTAGAALMSAYEPGDADAWTGRAEALAVRFRTAFAVEDAAGPFFAAALGNDGRPVAVASSAMGHLLGGGPGSPVGSGILGDADAAAVAHRLLARDLNCGWGLRGTGARTPGYHPLAARGGVVRAHDTCVAVAGLAARGHPEAAWDLLSGLLDAAVHFGHRMPEMHAGEQRLPGHGPIAHPLACRPLARAAAAVVPVLTALAGLRPDVPAGRVVVRPPGPPECGELELRDLRVAGQSFTVRVNRAGQAVVEEAAPSLQLAV